MNTIYNGHGSSTTFCELKDVHDSTSSIDVKVCCSDHAGIGVWIDGHSTKTAPNEDPDAVAYLEFENGRPVLHVWADINSEEPTHTIDLSGANVSHRLSIFKGDLYYYDDDEIKHHLASFEEEAANPTLLERKVLDKHWDDRLDSASCSPHFEYEIEE
jgi:hypothetical protein